jgi:hypothetical protein
VTVTADLQILTQQRVTLPGVANFLLKGLTRETTTNGLSTNNRFRFRLGNSDGTTWYFSGGIGATTDRVVDTLCFGTGQFPFPVIPPIPYSAGASILFEIEDLGGSNILTVPPGGTVPNGPYVINIAFHGSYLIPVSATGSTTSTSPSGS